MAERAPRHGAAGSPWQALLRFATGVLGIVLLTGCGADPPAATPARAPIGPVLIMTPGPTETTEYLERLLATGEPGGNGFPRYGFETLTLVDVPQVRADLLKLREQGKRYTAVFSHSQTMARLAQTMLPDTPIVFEGVSDPMRECLVDSLHRPARNATGYMHHLNVDDQKLLELLHDAFPQLDEALLLVSATNLPPPSCDPDDAYWTTPIRQPCTPGERALDEYIERRIAARELQEYARALGMRLRFVVACSAQDFEPLARWGASRKNAGWVVPWHSMFTDEADGLVAAINPTRRPAVYPHHSFTRAGGLMSMSALLDDGEDRASVLALLQVLRGRDPATLPVQMPRGFSLQVNGRTAEQLSPRPSLFVMRRADQVLR